MKEILRQYWGFDTLRPLQADAISAALSHHDSLVVMPTGGGKSLCYQVPPLVNDSLDVVVSPLIALMKDQVDGLREAGYPAIAMHSGLDAAARREAQAALMSGEARLLFISPERLVMDGFQQMLQRLGVRRFAIDEAHCISQWGHDFRPEYRQLAVLRDRFPDASIHAFTATATPQVREDIARQLNLRQPSILVGRFDRANLIYRVLPREDVQRQTAEVIERHADEAVIVYCLSRADTESMAQWLKSKGVKAAFYHAGMANADRHRTQEAFAKEDLDVVVATVAFGMGIDRSNVRCVIHTTIPKSIEHYQQETGRAGRDGLEAECVLFYSAADGIRWRSLIEKSAQAAEDPSVVIATATELLRHMESFSNSAVCRHKALSEYFGQAYDQANCGACDVCLNEVDVVPESTTIAQKVISCVARLRERFGVGQVVDVLQGADTENVRRFGHEKLTTYGLLKSLPKKTLQGFVYQILDQGLISRSGGEFPVLQLNTESWRVLRSEREVKLIRPREKLAKQTRQAETDWTGADMGLFEALRKWRRDAARQHNVPPYVVLTDASLMHLAKARPTREESLVQISGIGEKKREMWGEAIVDQITTYCLEAGLSTDQFDDLPYAEAAPALARPPKRTTGGAKPAADELFEQGATLDEVAEALQRARSTVAQYLEQYIYDRRPADIGPWVSAATYARVREAMGASHAPGISSLFRALNEEVPYDAIRLVVAHLRSRGA